MTAKSSDYWLHYQIGQEAFRSANAPTHDLPHSDYDVQNRPIEVLI
jgi:hypothetical protein